MKSAVLATRRLRFAAVGVVAGLLLPSSSFAGSNLTQSSASRTGGIFENVNTKSTSKSKTTSSSKSGKDRQFTQSPWKKKPDKKSVFMKKTKPTKADFNFDLNTIERNQVYGINVFGDEFKLPDQASAGQIVTQLQAELKCDQSKDTTLISSIFPVYGTSIQDTLALCLFDNAREDGFIFYVTTSKDALSLFNSGRRPVITTDFKNTYIYSSLRAVVMVVGGTYAFDASEISYDILAVLGYQPERTKLGP